MTYPQVYTSRVIVSVELSNKMWLAHGKYEHAKAGCLVSQHYLGTKYGEPDFLTILERLENLSVDTRAQEWIIQRFEVEMDAEHNTAKIRKEIYDTVSAYIREAKTWLENNSD